MDTLDLRFERKTDLPIQHLWKGWTDPEMLKKWFCPRPWRVTECRIDLKAGGEFFTVMEGPQGEKMHNAGCYLEVIEHKKLVWTNLCTKGFRPVDQNPMGFAMVACIEFEKSGGQTFYTATVMHTNEASRRQHEQMGFQEGWGLAFNQLVELFG